MPDSCSGRRGSLRYAGVPTSAVHAVRGVAVRPYFEGRAEVFAGPTAVSEADVELFRSLLIACNGRVNTNHPPGGGVTDLRVPKAMLANGASLEQDVLPTLRAHAGELTQRPLASWSEAWFVQGVDATHRRRLAAQRPAAPSPAIHDEDLIDQLMAAAGGNVLTGGIHD